MNRREVIRNVALMLGGTFSAPTLLAMNNWESATKANINSGDFSLTTSEQMLIAEIAEIILPKSIINGQTSPGAKEVGVPAFVEMMLKDCYKAVEQKSFVEGLATLQKVKFLELNKDEKSGVLKLMEQESKIYTGKVIPFWRLMKELTLLGYFTSEEGLKASFDYHPIPGKLENIKISSSQKSFAY